MVKGATVAATAVGTLCGDLMSVGLGEVTARMRTAQRIDAGVAHAR